MSSRALPAIATSLLLVVAVSCTGDGGGTGGPAEGASTSTAGAATSPPDAATSAPGAGTTPPLAGATTSTGPTTTSPRMPALEVAIALSTELAARMGVVLDGAAQSCAASVVTGGVGVQRLVALPAGTTIAELTQAERDLIAEALEGCVPPAAVAVAFAPALELPSGDAERTACLGRELLDAVGVGGLVAVADGLAAGVAPSAQVRSAARRAAQSCPVATSTTSSA